MQLWCDSLFFCQMFTLTLTGRWLVQGVFATQWQALRGGRTSRRDMEEAQQRLDTCVLKQCVHLPILLGCKFG